MDAREMGRKGGRARAKSLSAEQKHKIAVEGGKASAEARRKKKQRKQNNHKLPNHRGGGVKEI